MNNEDIDHTVEGALETMIGFENAITNVELKAGELFHLLESRAIDPAPVYEIFRIISGIHFQLAEAHEYQALIRERRKKAAKSNGGGEKPQEFPAGQENATNGAAAPSARPARALRHFAGLEPALVSRLMTSYAFCGNYIRALLGAR